MSKKNIKTEVLVLGSGPAGNTAAIYTKRAGFETIIVAGRRIGGQLTTTSSVENFPGFKEAIGGLELMDLMMEQSKNLGVNLIHDFITEVNFDSKPMSCKGENGNTYEFDALIIATGAEARWLGVSGESEFKGFGVSGCAICDGSFFRNQNVAVIGGGDAAVEEALYMSKIAKKVTLVHRRDSLRAEKVMQDKLFKAENVEIIWNTTVKKINGKENPKMVTSVVLNDVKEDKQRELEVDGVFVAIGYKPSSVLFKNTKLKINEKGYIITDSDSTKTNIKGVFAAGDVANKGFKQAVVASGYGCIAALEVGKYLENK